MPALRSCEHLRREHDLIEQVLEGLDLLKGHGSRRSSVPEPPISGAIEFFSAFVQRCHDRKEEDVLFPVLEVRQPGDALAPVRSDHDEERQQLATLRTLSRHPRDGAEVLAALDAYGQLLRRHIARENDLVLPLAELMLSPDDDVLVESSFGRIEEHALGADGRAVSLALAGAVTHACVTIVASAKTPTGAVARQAMRAHPSVVAPEESLARAAEIMESLGSREVPVVARGVLVGILTRSDMEPHRGHYEWTVVQTAMTPDPVTVSPDWPATEVAQLLLERGFNSVPVAVGRKLLGMIACRDVLRVLA